MKSDNFKNIIKTIFFSAALFAVLIIFDYKCPIKSITGISCPGCGMTRAWLFVLRLDFIKAFYYHPGFLLGPVIAFLLFGAFRTKKRIETFLAASVGIILFIIYIIRIFNHFPDVF